MSLTSLQTATGPAYIDLDRIEAISAIFTQGKTETRQVTTQGGARVFVLASPENYAKLKHLLPADASALAKTAPEPAKTPKPKPSRRTKE